MADYMVVGIRVDLGSSQMVGRRFLVVALDLRTVGTELMCYCMVRYWVACSADCSTQASQAMQVHRQFEHSGD